MDYTDENYILLRDIEVNGWDKNELPVKQYSLISNIINEESKGIGTAFSSNNYKFTDILTKQEVSVAYDWWIAKNNKSNWNKINELIDMDLQIKQLNRKREHLFMSIEKMSNNDKPF